MELGEFMWDFLEYQPINMDVESVRFSIKVVEVVTKMVQMQFVFESRDFKKLISFVLKTLDFHIAYQLNTQDKRKSLSVNEQFEKAINQLYVQMFQLVIVLLRFSVLTSSRNLVQEFKRRQYIVQKQLQSFESSGKNKDALLRREKKQKELHKSLFENFYQQCIKDDLIYLMGQGQRDHLLNIIYGFLKRSKNKELLKQSLHLLDDLCKQNRTFSKHFS